MRVQFEELFETANEHLTRGNYGKSRAILENILSSGVTGKVRIKTRILLSRVAMQIDDYQTARSILEEELPVAEKLDYTEGVADCKLDLGFLFMITGDMGRERPLELLKEGLRLWEALGDEKNIGRALNRLAQYYELMDDYDKALDTFNEALTFREAAEDFAGLGSTCSQIAWIYAHTKGDLDKGNEYLQKAQKAYERVGDRMGLANVLHTHAGLLMLEGKYNEALSKFRSCLEIFTQIDSISGIAVAKNNMALVYDRMGEFDASLAAYEEVKNLFEAINDEMGVAIALQNMANLKSELGYREEAISLARQSLEIFEKLQSKSSIAILYGDLAEIYNRSGDTVKAYESFIACMDFYSQVESHEEYVEKLCAFTDFLNSIGDAKKGKEFLEKAREIAQAHGSEPELLRVQLSRAITEKSQDNIREALRLFKDCYVTAEKSGDFSIMIQSSIHLAELSLTRYRMDSSNEDGYQEAMRLVDRSSRLARKANLYPVYVNTMLIKANLYAAKLEFPSALNALSIAMVTAEKRKLFTLRPKVRQLFVQMQQRQSVIKALSTREFTDEVTKNALDQMREVESLRGKK
ncbi:MAG: tetratricopeptide repeat protein [Candidatus Odinarchaeota archaeon]